MVFSVVGILLDSSIATMMVSIEQATAVSVIRCIVSSPCICGRELPNLSLVNMMVLFGRSTGIYNCHGCFRILGNNARAFVGISIYSCFLRWVWGRKGHFLSTCY